MDDIECRLVTYMYILYNMTWCCCFRVSSGVHELLTKGGGAPAAVLAGALRLRGRDVPESICMPDTYI